MFIVYGCVMSSILFSVHCHCLSTDIKAIDSVGVPPLPIPNREVKPDSADGTANFCGRVGHRHFYKNPGTLKSPWIFLYSVANLLSRQCRLSGSPAKSGGLSKKFSQSIEEKL